MWAELGVGLCQLRLVRLAFHSCCQDKIRQRTLLLCPLWNLIDVTKKKRKKKGLSGQNILPGHEAVFELLQSTQLEYQQGRRGGGSYRLRLLQDLWGLHLPSHLMPRARPTWCWHILLRDASFHLSVT